MPEAKRNKDRDRAADSPIVWFALLCHGRQAHPRRIRRSRPTRSSYSPGRLSRRLGHRLDRRSPHRARQAATPGAGPTARATRGGLLAAGSREGSPSRGSRGPAEVLGRRGLARLLLEAAPGRFDALGASGTLAPVGTPATPDNNQLFLGRGARVSVTLCRGSVPAAGATRRGERNDR